VPRSSRIFIGVILALPLLWLLLFGSFVFLSGVEGLDGVGYWDGSCYEAGLIESIGGIATGALVPGGFCVALVAWIAAKRWWWRPAAVGFVTLLLFLGAVSVAPSATGEVSGQRCEQELPD
jgi:hypothetical protein